MLQRARPEPCVEQVQDRVLDAADILVDRQPLLRARPVERFRVRLAGEADEIPRRIDERVERIGLASCIGAAGRAGDVLPGWMAIERVAGDVERHVLGQDDRQLVLGYRHRAACVAVDDRDRRAPVTLAADAPVAQAEHGRALAPAFALGALDHDALGVLDVHAVEEGRVHDGAGAGPGGVADENGRLVITFADDALDGQVVFAREIEIALVVRGHAEHRAGAVFHQHEVRDVDREVPRLVERMHRAQAGVEAELFLRVEFRRSGAAPLAQFDEGRGVRVCFGDRACDRVVSRDRDEARSEHRVGTRRKHLDALYSPSACGRG